MSGPDWTSGYVADVDYTFGYYPELNPLRARLLLLNQGFAPPQVQTACELGFGQGLSINIHAAGSPVEWWGTDFNPSQASFARTLSAASGSGARLFDESFAEFAARPDLPDFDFVGLHGIWSWVSDTNRAVLVEFLRRRLRPGGLLYVSYNALPGWAGFLPMRDLLTSVAGAGGGGTIEGIERALAFAEGLLATNPIFSRANPVAAERIKRLRGQERAYLAHEYFNRDWRPMSFGEVAGLLSQAKLAYAGTAHYPDHMEAVNLTPEQADLLKGIADPVLQQGVRDLMVNRQFRRDYWIKGPVRLSALERLEAIRDERVMLSTPRQNIALKVAGALGDAALNAAIYEPVIEALSDLKPRSLGELAGAVEGQGVGMPELVEAVLVLCALAYAAPVQADAAAKAARPRAQALNAWLQARARSHADIGVLASPVTGAGVGLGRFDQLFLTAAAQGVREPRRLAEQAWAVLAAQGQGIVKDGAALTSPEDNLAELVRVAEAFTGAALPVVKALGLL